METKLQKTAPFKSIIVVMSQNTALLPVSTYSAYSSIVLPLLVVRTVLGQTAVLMRHNQDSQSEPITYIGLKCAATEVYIFYIYMPLGDMQLKRHSVSHLQKLCETFRETFFREVNLDHLHHSSEPLSPLPTCWPATDH